MDLMGVLHGLVGVGSSMGGWCGTGMVFFTLQALVLPASLWIHVTSQGNLVDGHIAYPCEPEGAC